MTFDTTVTNTFQFDEYTIEILYLEYSGGGTCYEYRITKDGSLRVQSDDEFGQREAAAGRAFMWLSDNE